MSGTWINRHPSDWFGTEQARLELVNSLPRGGNMQFQKLDFQPASIFGTFTTATHQM